MLTTNTESIPLRHLQKGQTAVIEEIAGSTQEVARLTAMGFIAGAVVRMLCPGCACALQLGDSRMVMRGDSLGAIRVSPI